MTKTAHTAGPWHGQGEDGRFPDTPWTADNDQCRRTTFAPIFDANGKTVALVVREDWDDAKLIADARLIAAAPELLEALVGAIETIELLDIEENYPNSLASYRAAIAKATGEQP